ncbi:MAG: 50S ribosomal protein L1 [Endozoicomonadaceae bacterium]|nr:50S ribosomal protein L1 [Endozoicomonadaceae bacterium]
MGKLSKRAKLIESIVKIGFSYTFTEAVETLKKCSTVKFNESVDIAINLGVDARKSDQVVRGSILMPKGTGKSVRVAVFAQGEQAEAAKKAGAEFVGMDDLAADIKSGNMAFDVVIAAPDAMRIVGQLGQVLGPRGLMPNPKLGTVTPNVLEAVKNAKAGQVRFRNDKNGIIHAGIGRVAFSIDDLLINTKAFIEELKRIKPSSSKGVYIKKITISTTMGPGLAVDLASLDN